MKTKAMTKTPTNTVYRGWLVEGFNGEESVLSLKEDLFRSRGNDEILADQIRHDISIHGHNLTVRYFIMDQPVVKGELEQEIAKTLLGVGEAKYNMRYSEITGYLWTDEEINVGGHDLLGELQASIGKFLHMEIEYG